MDDKKQQGQTPQKDSQQDQGAASEQSSDMNETETGETSQNQGYAGGQVGSEQSAREEEDIDLDEEYGTDLEEEGSDLP